MSTAIRTAVTTGSLACDEATGTFAVLELQSRLPRKPGSELPARATPTDAPRRPLERNVATPTRLQSATPAFTLGACRSNIPAARLGAPLVRGKGARLPPDRVRPAVPNLLPACTQRT